MLRVRATKSLGSLDLDVSLELADGECLALTGPSGAGKTTILRIVAGLTAPETGQVACGEDLWFDSNSDICVAPELRGCGYVFQDYALFGHLNAWQNVAYPLKRMRRSQRRGHALELLDRFGMAALADARPATLSGGERQRVGLARALALQPRVLLLDEPLSALDARTRASATRELAAVLRESEIPMLLVTHDFGQAALLADRVAVIDAGRVIQEGLASDLAARPASSFVADLTGAVVLSGYARCGPDGLTSVDLDAGGVVVSTDEGAGPVAVSVFPWEISLEPGGRGSAAAMTSARNHIEATVDSVTQIGSRVRVGLSAGQPLVAEVTPAAVVDLGLAPGVAVAATWKAAATRVVPR